LIIQLKRFHLDEDKGTYRKNDLLVKYPEQLQILGREYKLMGVVLHFGTLDGGHYTALCRREGKWFEFNDESVSEVGDATDHK
jgi:ubiquitin C-terminal hydrolase